MIICSTELFLKKIVEKMKSEMGGKTRRVFNILSYFPISISSCRICYANSDGRGSSWHWNFKQIFFCNKSFNIYYVLINSLNM